NSSSCPSLIPFQISNTHLSNPSLSLLTRGRLLYPVCHRKILTFMRRYQMYFDLAPETALFKFRVT
ncbi:unnamed protein product, partial [Hymenolepis diminuta]